MDPIYSGRLPSRLPSLSFLRLLSTHERIDSGNFTGSLFLSPCSGSYPLVTSPSSFLSPTEPACRRLGKTTRSPGSESPGWARPGVPRNMDAIGPESPLLWACPRRRQVKSSPSSFPVRSPVDSGYGSAPASPQSPCLPLKEVEWSDEEGSLGLWKLLDGNLSDLDDPFADDGNPPVPVELEGARREEQRERQLKPFTLPKRSARSRPCLPASFFSDSDTKLVRRNSNSNAVGVTRSAALSAHIQDRFIPYRSDSAIVVQKFRTGKAPHELTTSEKLLRHNGDAEDAFCYRRRRITPLAAELRVHSQSESIPGGIRAGSVLGPVGQNTGENPVRQVSHGTVWTVRGVVPNAAAVDNGRGQLIQSGTNARLFRTAFPARKPRAEEELEKHEARIAAALGMDRTQRVLGMNMVFERRENARERREKTSTQWNGAEWVREDWLACECSAFELPLPRD